MIPKIIHYCWFGRGPMPDLALNCISSWHKYLPGYEYRLWNEDNFDINSVPYVKEAYEARRFAFVTDYVRLWALYHFGGIYMDTDVEILKPLDDLLNLSAFTGYEGSKYQPPVTGLMASVAKGTWVTEQLGYYDKRHFLLGDGSLDLTTNTQIISGIMAENGFVSDGKYQIYKDLHVFPVEYFCPRLTTGELKITDETYCDHHFTGSWKEPRNVRAGIKGFLLNLLPLKVRIGLIKLKRYILH